MDNQTLNALRAAHKASPDNPQLLLALLLALRDGEQIDEAAELLDRYPPEHLDPAGRLTAAQILITAEQADKALLWADFETAEAALVRARACLALGRTEQGRAHYEAALAANPTLEDPGLAEQLKTRVREVDRGDERPRLRVISNDDTIEDEAERLLVPDPEPVTFAQVGGLDEIKKQIHRKIILPFQKPSLFRKFRKRIGGGILLYGPPGCGKTLLARATAGECGATFFNVAISDVLDMYIGESEQKLHALFEKARSSVPAVLFFDEIEALGGKRQYTREAASSKIVSQFLSEMDGFAQDNEGVLILGATNVPWAVDPAFRRPGRFDRVLFVPPPDREARQQILEILLEDRPQTGAVDLDFLSKQSSGFSGADLQNLVESAADLAIEESIEGGQEVPIGKQHLRDSLRDVRPTTLEWLTTARNYARYANEAGHYDDVLAFLERHGKN
jgi:AAA+ superfamily predicted ATPase